MQVIDGSHISLSLSSLFHLLDGKVVGNDDVSLRIYTYLAKSHKVQVNIFKIYPLSLSNMS
ncbi:hypothetical protein HanXRQr2_Chr09g0363011 [Helianthus annuus]|uniref:Uncharacterized protein n=1 Tax=Helianthus annuus TaxID=4232 RepID=A0A9K3I1G4_HELAN|nr:hypothetical protein HanXRQr2_Chr09g0363011 [Helianthus annuus]